jgi:hypothetical protein
MESIATDAGRRADTLKVVIMVTLVWAINLLGLMIYVFSGLAAWKVGGGMATAMTLFTPPLGQIFWVYWAWATTGSLLTPYAIACYVWAGLLLAQLLSAALLSRD